MQISVEQLNGLERKITISVASDKLEAAFNEDFRALASTAEVRGFRRGKVPVKILEQRFSDTVLGKAANKIIEATLYEAIRQNNLLPADAPRVEPQQLQRGKEFVYTATFEVYPEVSIREIDDKEIDIIAAEVGDADVDEMIRKLQEQNKEWKEVPRVSAKGDKLDIDFIGYTDNEPFQGGEAKNFEVILGSGSMIPGFEEGLIGKEQGESFDLTVSFPEDYGHKDLAGKEALFKITVNKVFQGELPALDDSFAEKFNITEGGVEAFKKDIKENMVRELEQRVNSMNREASFNALMEVNPFDVPAALVEREIKNLQHEMYHRLFGHEHHENEKIPDFPRQMFEDQAKRRVHLGLLFSEYVKKHDLKPEQSRVDAMIEKLASAYEVPDELRQYYRSKEQRSEIESMVLEEIAAEKIRESAKINTNKKSYDEVMSPKKGNTKGE